MAERTLDLGELQALLERVRGLKVACVGDLMLDRYVYGEVSRISPEAPIPVLKTRRTVAMAGAVGNVARNVGSLGGSARLGAAVGQDAAGFELLALIKQDEGVDSFVEVSPSAPTIVKTRYVAAGQQLLRLDDEETGDRRLPSNGVFDGAASILISDYAKGSVNAALMDEALAASKVSGAPVIVDPKGTDFARYGAVDVIKPNASELAGATGLPVDGRRGRGGAGGSAGRHDGQGPDRHPRGQGHEPGGAARR
jgi:D-beta-D-heptose 7-phosphate kinase/D-beta-D-heptose 1-phosphate adenosyltransferase